MVGCYGVAMRRGRLRPGVAWCGGNVNVEVEAKAVVVVEQEKEMWYL